MIATTTQTNHIIFISIDNLRFDCIGYQPNKSDLKKYQLETLLKTPNLDKIAEKSVCFTNVISTSTYTTASHASILTGLYPPKHGVRAFYDTKLSTQVYSITELLKSKGFLTILCTDAMELWSPLDLHKGFSHIFERQDKELFEFLNSHKDNSIFLFVHFFDVHEPYLFSEYELFKGYNSDYYNLLDDFAKKNNLDLGIVKDKPHSAWKKFADYLKRSKKNLFPLFVKGVNKFDNGRFKNFITNLEHLGLQNNSLLVIFSDHGEGRCMEDKDFFAHAGGLYEDVIKVPLIIKSNHFAHKIIDTQISTVDIFPTIMELLFNNKMSIPYRIDGRSLMPEIEGSNSKDHLTYSEVWTSDSGIYLGDGNKGKPHVCSSKRSMNWILFQRALKNENKKYIICGKPDANIDCSAFSYSNEDFIKTLYRSLLGRIEDKSGFEHHLNLLNQNLLSKKDILNSFIQSEEYKLNNKFVMFDLEEDPEELNPIDPLKNPSQAMDFFKNINIILTLEKDAVCSEKIFSNEKLDKILHTDEKKDAEEDENRIRERLKALGYFGK